MNPTKWHQLDIATLAPFELPATVCQDCRAISRTTHRCIYCAGANVIDLNSALRVDDRYRHAVKFAIVSALRVRAWGAAEVVEEIICSAKLYVHFATYSIDYFFLELIERALVAGVQVAGLVGKPTDSLSRRINELNMGYPYLCNILTWPPCGDFEEPHQKILVADGCVAISGSMNLTQAGFKKHGLQPPREFVWPFTDVDSVVAINNEYLSPFYLQFKPLDYCTLDELENAEFAPDYKSIVPAPASGAPHVNIDLARFLGRSDRKAIVRRALERLSQNKDSDLPSQFPRRFWAKICNFIIMLELKDLGQELVGIKYNCLFSMVVLVHRRQAKIGTQKGRQGTQMEIFKQIAKITIGEVILKEPEERKYLPHQ